VIGSDPSFLGSSSLGEDMMLFVVNGHSPNANEHSKQKGDQAAAWGRLVLALRRPSEKKAKEDDRG
jgi:hypothetical protein